MRKLIKISAIAVALAAVASCNLNKMPVFTDDMSYAAFDNASMSVSEKGDSILIPITIASIDPVKASVAYKLIVDDAYAAKEGEDFEFVEEGGVLVFDGEQRTASIGVKIFPHVGTFTGDLKFALEIESAGDLNIGHENTCEVTILDTDHPLNFILGKYASNDTEDYWGDAYSSWEIEIAKDPTDLTVVWISNIEPYFAGYGYLAPYYNYFYGNVNSEKTEIVMPQGQATGYVSSSQGSIDLLGMNDAGEDDDVYISITDDGKTLTMTNYWGVCSTSGWWSLFKPNAVVFTKE